jgi:hypothetical protein
VQDQVSMFLGEGQKVQRARKIEKLTATSAEIDQISVGKVTINLIEAYRVSNFLFRTGFLSI